MTFIEGLRFGKYPLIRQYDKIDCGHFSLLTSLKYYCSYKSFQRIDDILLNYNESTML